ncbi:MAG: hypothetical protein IJ087_09115 [Eggerthellaceae bacterium]|nr:hypothetical protein [Eggerthellaceae bacterium]
MEGIDNNFAEISEHEAEGGVEPTIVQEWTEVDLEASHGDIRVADDADIAEWQDVGDEPDWLDRVSLEDLEKMDSIDDLYEKLSMSAEGSVDIPDDEGFQKVKRW